MLNALNSLPLPTPSHTTQPNPTLPYTTPSQPYPTQHYPIPLEYMQLTWLTIS